MAENVKDIAMRIKHDGVVYGFDAGTLVKTTGEQSIDGVKTFATLPKSSATPAADDDLVTKKYLDDQLNPSPDVSVTVSAVTSDSTGWCGISNVQFFLDKDVQLFPFKMEEGNLAKLKEPKLMIFTTEKQSSPAPTKVPKQEILDYQLRPGDFRGLFYTADLLGEKNTVHPTDSWQDPFTKGQGYLTRGDRIYGGSQPQLKIVVHDLGQIIAKVGVSTSSYPASSITASSTVGEMTEEGTPTTGENEKNFAFSKNLNGAFRGSVLLTGDQHIDGVKTFYKAPKSEAAPSEPNDLVNKKCLDDIVNKISGAVGSVTGLIKGKNSANTYASFSYLKWLLNNGKRLDVKMVENVTVSNATAPVLAVWHVVDTVDGAITPPTKKTKKEIEDYVLQPGEYKGTLSYFKVVGKFGYYSGEPWTGYCLSGQQGKLDGMLGFTINDLDIPFKGITFQVGRANEDYAYQFDELEFSGTNCGNPFKITDNKKYTNKQPVTIEVPVVSTELQSFVTVGSTQSITGAKTFAVPPKSVAPAAPDDLVTKNYVDNTFLQSPKSDVDIRIGVKSGTSAWNAFSHLNIVLANGKRLEAKYMEDVIYQDATPAKVVLKTADNTEDIAPAPTRQAKDFFDTYQLADGEFFAELIFANGVGNGRIHSNKEQACPWDAYLVGNLNRDEIADLFKLTIKQLDVTIDYVQIHCGDNHNGYGYLPKYFYLVAAANGADTGEIKSKEGLTNKEIIKFAIPKGSLAVGLGSFVTVDSTQTISGVKTFSKLPKSTVEPIEATELATKAYVDAKSGMSNSDIPEQEVTVFSKSSSSAIIAFSKLKLFLGNGTQIYPIFYEKQSSYGALDAPLNVVFSIAPAYHNGEPTIPYPNEKPKDELDSYVLKNGEFKGTFTPVNLCGGKYVFATASGYNSDSWKLPWNNYAVFSNGEKDSTPILRINIKGKLPSITKVSFTADGTYFGDKFSASVGVNGSNGKQSEELQSATEKLCDLVCEDSKLYNDFYLDTVSNQTAFGIKSFLNCPKIITEQPQLKNESTNVMSFANVAHSIGIGVPEKQYITLNSSTTWNKQSAGGSNWTYTLSLNVYYSNLVPAFISPITGQITPLYIKYYCSDGRAVLTTEGTQMPDKGAVEAKSTSEMDSYRLKYNEYLCRFYWYFLNKLGNTQINGEWITKNSRDGSKVLDLFTNSSGSWASYTTGQLKDPTNYDGPASAAFVEFYNVPTIRFIKAYCSASSAGGSTAKLYCSQYGMLDTKSNGKGTASAEYNSSEFKEFDDGNRFDLHAGYPSGPVELMRVAPIIALMQENISKLEERIKALESPKP